MEYFKSVPLIFLLLNLCVMLCASLPLTYNEAGRAGPLSEKLFPSTERSFEDSYGHYLWNRDERTRPFPLASVLQNENAASQFEIEQSMRDREQKRTLLRELILREILNKEKTRLEQDEQSKTTDEKREPQKKCRQNAGQFGCGGKRREVFNNDMEKTTLEQDEQSKTTNEKREPRKCRHFAGQLRCYGQRTELFNNDMTQMDSEAGPKLMDAYDHDKDMDKIKQYDMEIERALQELEKKMPSDMKM